MDSRIAAAANAMTEDEELIANVKRDHPKILDAMERHEQRLTKLEARQWPDRLLAGAVGIAIGASVERAIQRLWGG